MLTEKDILEFKKASNLFNIHKGKIVDRVHEIVELICDAFNKELVNWWFPGAEEGSVGNVNLAEITDKDEYCEITIETNPFLGRVETIEWNYCSGFPQRFLFMSNEDISVELNKQIEAFKEKEKAKIDKVQVEYELTDEIEKRLNSHILGTTVSTALSKLSIEEKRALKLLK